MEMNTFSTDMFFEKLKKNAPKLSFCHLRKFTLFENHRKSLIQHCERSELRFHFEWTKVNQKCQKLSILASF